jgi:hypothetical protein
MAPPYRCLSLYFYVCSILRTVAMEVMVMADALPPYRAGC